MYLVLEMQILKKGSSWIRTQLQWSPLRSVMLEQTNQYCQSQHQLVILTADPAELCSAIQKQLSSNNNRLMWQITYWASNSPDWKFFQPHRNHNKSTVTNVTIQSGMCACSAKLCLQQFLFNAGSENLSFRGRLWRMTNEDQSTQHGHTIFLNLQNYLISANDCCYKSQSCQIVHCIGRNKPNSKLNQ